jgi:multimeric flavodoxin WrbA
MPLRAIALNCTLKPSPETSSTDVLLGELCEALRKEGADIADPVRVVDLDIRPGVTSDEGDGDAWPDLRRQILDADVLAVGTPVWLGQPSSVAKRVLERLDAFLGETDDAGRLLSYGKVAVVVVVGNEDGAHHVSAELFQALNDVGFTIPAGAVTYWVGEAVGRTDYKDLDAKPEAVTSTTATVARNAVHVAGLLADRSYPAG